MTIDLAMLLASVAIYFVLTWIPAIRTAMEHGPFKLLGNRDAIPVYTGKQARPEKAAANMAENLLMFAPLVLIAHVAGLNDDLTARGAQIFVIARLAHAICYLMGAPVLRSIAYIGGLIGMVMIATRLIGAL